MAKIVVAGAAEHADALRLAQMLREEGHVPGALRTAADPQVKPLEDGWKTRRRPLG